MALSSEQFELISRHLLGLTPEIVKDVEAWMQTDPQMVANHGQRLHHIAEQAVTAFREVLLGAFQYELPTILVNEINWLDRLLAARSIPPENIGTFLNIFRERAVTSLPTAEAQLLEQFFAKATALLAKKIK